MYIVLMNIRDEGETKNCPGIGEAECWISPEVWKPPKTSSNQSPAIALEDSPVNTPDQVKTNDLTAAWSYLNSEYSSSVNTAENNDPRAKIFAFSDQLFSPVAATPPDTTTTDYASPLSENLGISSNDGVFLASGDASPYPNLFLDSTV